MEPSGLVFILKEEPVNPQANPALAKLEGVAEGTFQLLYVEYTANICSQSAVEVQWNDCTPPWTTVIHYMRCSTAIHCR